MGEDQDSSSGVGAAEWDVAQLAVDSEGDGAVLVDAVVADAVVRGWGVPGRGGFGECLIAGGGGRVVGQGAVGSVLVVVVDEGVDLLLQLGDGVGGSGGGESAFQGLLEPFDFALGLRVGG